MFIQGSLVPLSTIIGSGISKKGGIAGSTYFKLPQPFLSETLYLLVLLLRVVGEWR